MDLSSDGLRLYMVCLPMNGPSSGALRITKVTRDGSERPQSAWGVPMPVDPGDHTVQVTGSDRVPWSTKVGSPVNACSIEFDAFGTKNPTLVFESTTGSIAPSSECQSAGPASGHHWTNGPRAEGLLGNADVYTD